MLVNFLASMTVLSTTILCMLSNSWLMIWVMLEINAMGYCVLVKNSATKDLSFPEGGLKYFIIQSVASVLVLLLVLQAKELSLKQPIVHNLVTTAFMVKMASAPFHQWFIKMIKVFSLYNSFMLMTWQKLAPLYLIVTQTKKLIIFFSLLCSLVGSISLINKNNLMEIMAYTSVFNLSWLLVAVTLSSYVMLTFSALYWLTVAFVIMLIKKYNMKNLSFDKSTNNNKMMSVTVIANVGGFPPTFGFYAKYMMLVESLKMTLLTFSIIVVTLNTINMYMYMQMVAKETLKKSSPIKYNYQNTSKIVAWTMLMTNALTLFLLYF